MDRKDQGRKEPTLADLEAFEKLLRESLQVEQARPVAESEPSPATAPLAAQTGTPATPPAQPAMSEVTADRAAMAELARLIDQPVDFGQPMARQEPPPPVIDEPLMSAPIGAPVTRHFDASQDAEWRDIAPPAPAMRGQDVPPHEVQPREFEPYEFQAPEMPAQDMRAHDLPGHDVPGHDMPAHDLANRQAAGFESQAYAPAAAAPAPEPVDPLAAFEQELRRFDAIRITDRPTPSVSAPIDYEPVQPPVSRSDPFSQPATETGYAGYSQPAEAAWREEAAAAPAESEAQVSLHAAEERLAAQAAAAAATARKPSGTGRSRGIFLALGGVALAGTAVLAGTMLLGGSGSGSKGGAGNVPVIAARPEPAKERPVNPGGMEIPNQNKQVLSPRNANDSQPAQVVNNTEQPLDLNQVTRRDGVRVVAPSPYQGQGTTPEGSTASLEPRRVTSVRIPIGGEPVAQPTATTTSTPPAGIPVPPVGLGAVATAPSRPGVVPAPPQAAPAAPTPVNAPIPPTAPNRSEPPPAAAATPPKVESRPTTAQAVPRPTTDAAARPPAAPTPPRVANAPQANPSTNAAARPPSAPMVLSPNANARPPAPRPAPAEPASDDDAPAGGNAAPRTAAASQTGNFAVQLASRPTEDDARTASNQLRTRFSAALGGKAPSVISGTANGQTVYRVRVAGYSQAAAVEACNKVKAAGGSCFVTRQ